MKAMILAAGLGTRLRPATDHYAKPALPFLNIPLLYWALPILEMGGMTDLVLNLHYKPEQVRSVASQIPGFKGRVEFSEELEKPLGAGGGVWKAKRFLQGEKNFLLANGDEVIFPSRPNMMDLMMKNHLSHDCIATILVMRHPLVGTQFGGVWADSDGRVHGFGKTPPSTGTLTGFHYVGIQIVSERIFKYLPEGESNILYDALVAAIAKGETVRVQEENLTWFESGNPSDYLEATHNCLRLMEGSEHSNFIQNHVRRYWPRFSERSSLWMGADSTAPYSGSEVLIGNDCRVHPSCKLSGFVVVGDNVVVEEGAEIQNSVLMPGRKVGKGMKIIDQIFV